MSYDYDVLVIGSGFGGSVAAPRLTEKGYRVGVVEAGRRFDPDSYPKTSWDLRRFQWAPRLGCYGLQRIHLVKDAVILAATGVGGGSLVYANTLYEPLDAFYDDRQWSHITGETFHPTPVGVFFGGPHTPPGTEVEDPYFGGAGPARRSCIRCGSCMTGCRHDAKNTLDKNYLYLAERVVFAAGTYNTQKLLHRLRDEGTLPRLSPRLGTLTRTNSEAILGAKSRDPKADYTRGVAITSSFHPDEHTHIEPVRYGKGSNAMGLLQTVLTDGGRRIPRWLTWLLTMIRHPRNLALLSVRLWSEKTIILMVMQTVDNSIRVAGRRGRFGRYKLTSTRGHGEPNPTWIPVCNETARRVAQLIDGIPGGTLGEIANIPMTAHFIGGCAIGDGPDTGTIDPWHRLYGHPGLHVTDGSAISANLGVNPSLTITAQAERALAFWPNKGEPDPRPPVGSPYRRLRPVAPRRPAVPAHAPAAPRLPLTAPTTGDVTGAASS